MTVTVVGMLRTIGRVGVPLPYRIVDKVQVPYRVWYETWSEYSWCLTLREL